MSVNWLDEGRESCLIDGVRYTKRWAIRSTNPDGVVAYFEFTSEEAARETAASKPYECEAVRILAPIDQHPDPYADKNGLRWDDPRITGADQHPEGGEA